MSAHCKLVTLMLALALGGQVHTGKIIGGHEVVPHSRPYMVLLERHMEDKKTKYCGGFLLNEDFVMTAAHCQAKFFTVLLGVHNISDKNTMQRISVEQAFPHKKYNPTDFKNDIMLLKLSSKAKINKYVAPISLAGQLGSLPKSCIVTGWGKYSNTKDYMSYVLLEVNVTLTANNMCAKDNFYCSEGETGPSEGDSGGPLVCEDGRAFGVVSSTFTPHPGGPIIKRYAKIPEDKHFIKSP
ncbi:Granzyme G [Channa argus]|uniref:trypsin n=1 Tax=Channa argus TaxID=215402 RepID=A0A6G1PLR0_CHAAH|nr:Granzyme G [Channa argus]KAK2907705.1 hypothetical protein Q8A73_008778 [Channa argus]